MTSYHYTIGVIILLFLITCVTRALPFAFGKKMQGSKLILFIGTQLPTSILLLLGIYYMLAMAKPTDWHNLPWQLIALVATLLVHWRWRNVTLSIVVGTGLYLLLNAMF